MDQSSHITSIFSGKVISLLTGQKGHQSLKVATKEIDACGKRTQWQKALSLAGAMVLGVGLRVVAVDIGGAPNNVGFLLGVTMGH